jgi:hypothetical protein
MAYNDAGTWCQVEVCTYAAVYIQEAADQFGTASDFGNKKKLIMVA